MLDIRDATVYYPSGVQGVDNITLRVDDGEFCFITGASGSGKSTLSKLITGEMQQRVAIARAIINRPRLVIADEPTGNLDPKLAEEIMKILVDINGLDNTTVIVITHAAELVRKFQKRTIVLSEGRVVSGGGAAS